MENKIETAKIVNELFKTLTAIFPAFPQAWPNQETFEQAKAEWVKAFNEVNLHQIEKIKVGVKKFRLLGKPFVPSPGEFIAMCAYSPEEMGLPSTEMAFREACEKSHPAYGNEKKWSHVCVQWAARQVGSHSLCSLSRMASFPMFEKFYILSLEIFEQGEMLNQIENGTEMSDEIKKQNSIVMPQYKHSKGFGDALAFLGVRK